MRRHSRLVLCCLGLLLASCKPGAQRRLAALQSTRPSSSAAVSSGASQRGQALGKQVGIGFAELELGKVRELLASAVEGTPVRAARAKLALYQGDCEGAFLSLETDNAVRSVDPEVAQVAERCAKATAGALEVPLAEQGLWFRYQNPSDRVFQPLLVAVALRALTANSRDLGSELPRPLRIDVVADLASLSALTGLPLEAAETTGTVAIARWGRVTLLSPRATPEGYPWEDTLAHEIAHLVITRASWDNAPLWLQEGLAKRQETRWRAARPFDGRPNARVVAREALLSGHSVGIDHLGSSIALLPSPDAAQIAYAEAQSFVDYFAQQSGEASLRLLLLELGRGRRSLDQAMRSVGGYGFADWRRRFDDDLRRPLTAAESGSQRHQAALGEDAAPSEELFQQARLGSMLFERGAYGASRLPLAQALVGAPTDPALRWQLAAAELASGDREAAKTALGSVELLSQPAADWFVLAGELESIGATEQAQAWYRAALGVAPHRERAACRSALLSPLGLSSRNPPLEAPWDSLCPAARQSRPTKPQETAVPSVGSPTER